MTLFGSPAILALPAGFHTMTTKIWSLFQYPPKPELAAAASLPLLVLTVMLLRAEHMILGRRGYAVVGGKQGEPRLVRLGGWQWVGAGACAARAGDARCFCPTARCSMRPSRASPRNSSRSRISRCTTSSSCSSSSPPTKLAFKNTFILGYLVGDHRHGHRAA